MESINHQSLIYSLLFSHNLLTISRKFVLLSAKCEKFIRYRTRSSPFSHIWYHSIDLRSIRTRILNMYYEYDIIQYTYTSIFIIFTPHNTLFAFIHRIVILFPSPIKAARQNQLTQGYFISFPFLFYSTHRAKYFAFASQFTDVNNFQIWTFTSSIRIHPNEKPGISRYLLFPEK